MSKVVALKKDDATDGAPEQERSAWHSLKAARAHVSALFEDTYGREFSYHNVELIEELSRDAGRIADGMNLSETDWGIVTLAATFVHAGYVRTREDYAGESAQIAAVYLDSVGCPQEVRQKIIEHIRHAQSTLPPDGVTFQVLHDACVAHTGKRKFFERMEPLRYELESLKGVYFTDNEWDEYLARTLSEASFLTKYARDRYESRRLENFERVRKSIRKDVGRDGIHAVSEGRILERGIDTFFRTQSKNVLNLVSVADRKAQMLIHINSIVASILISFLPERIEADRWMVVPGTLFLAVNVATIVLAILAIKPSRVRSRAITREDLVKNNTTIVAEAMFNDVKYEDFKFGVNRMMGDHNFLYETLIQNLYGSAGVLKKKFFYLDWSYRVFMYGLGISVGMLVAVMAIKH